MLKVIKYSFLCAFLIPGLAFAHGPARQKVIEEIEVNAPPEKVWEIISEFCAIKDWHPRVTACESDNGTEPDSIRTITLDNGEQIMEQLVKILHEQHKFQYMMVEPNGNAFPINTHGCTISVTASDNGGSIVQWKGAFYRIFPGPNPPPDQTNEAGIEALTGFYKSGLENIKIMAEK